MASVTSIFGLGLRQFDGTKFEIPSKHNTASNFYFMNSNIITRNYGLNKTTSILVVAFLLSVSIFWTDEVHTFMNVTRSRKVTRKRCHR